MALFASSGFGTFFLSDCVFRGSPTRWCSLPLTSAMVQIGMVILFSLSSDMDEISVAFEIIILCLLLMEKKVVSSKKKMSRGMMKSRSIFDKLVAQNSSKVLDGHFTISFIFVHFIFSMRISNIPGIMDIHANKCCYQQKVCISGNPALLLPQVILP
jgi:hypothetical protein